MAGLLEGRSALVTGAGRGIGRATAVALASEGAGVVVNDVGCDDRGEEPTGDPADEVVTEIREAGGAAVASYDSVDDYDQAGRAVKAAVDAFGGLDIVVNNAGITAGSRLESLDPDLFGKVVGIHLFGTFNITRQAVSHLKESDRGRVVNLVSRAGLVGGGAGAAAYAAGKGGIFGFTNAICGDLLEFGITVNNVNPAATLTRMVTGAIENAKASGADPSMAERMIAAAQPPESVAAAIVALCLPDCDRITGRTFFVQGRSVSVFGQISPELTVVAEHEWRPSGLAATLGDLDIAGPSDLY